MKRGDLVKIQFSKTRIPWYPLGIIFKELNDMSLDARFFQVILPDGKIKIFSNHCLELIEKYNDG